MVGVRVVVRGGLPARRSGVSLLRGLIRRLGGYRLTPGRDVGYVAANSKHVASTGGLFRVIIINPVVIGTQHGQIRRIGGTSCFPRDEVMHLGIVSRLVASFPGTGGVLSTGHHALLKPG